MSKTIYIGGRLESKEKGNVVTGANAILDDTKGKKQNVINKETDDELLRLEQSKQDNLTFDNTPTEDSTNPVTSGGVYTAEKALSDAIEAILLLIPSAATALNKLVDTNTMNSSISTATATFRGTYNAVSDLGLTYQATHAQIEAALDALGLTADNNDFAFVQIPVSDQSQDIAKTERFKFNGTNWLYEYDLNTSGFTAAQWAAINSTITLALVQKLDALPTNTELLQALGLKQDVLTFDNAPTTDSNNPVKSGGIKTAIDTAVGDEATARDNADIALSGLIGDEKTRAEGVEGGLNTRLGTVEGSVSTIQGVIPSEATSSNKLVDNLSMTTYIGTIIDNIDATFNITSTDGHITLAITQVNGAITSVQLTTSDIASAAALNLKASQADLSALAGRVTTAEGNITSLTGRVTTNETDIANLQQLYNNLQQSAPEVIGPTDTWPVANPSTTVIYRVSDRVNTPPEYYQDYMWNGTAFVLMAQYNNAIDAVPTAGSNNLVKSGGVQNRIDDFAQIIIDNPTIDSSKFQTIDASSYPYEIGVLTTDGAIASYVTSYRTYTINNNTGGDFREIAVCAIFKGINNLSASYANIEIKDNSNNIIYRGLFDGYRMILIKQGWTVRISVLSTELTTVMVQTTSGSHWIIPENFNPASLNTKIDKLDTKTERLTQYVIDNPVVDLTKFEKLGDSNFSYVDGLMNADGSIASISGYRTYTITNNNTGGNFRFMALLGQFAGMSDLGTTYANIELKDNENNVLFRRRMQGYRAILIQQGFTLRFSVLAANASLFYIQNVSDEVFDWNMTKAQKERYMSRSIVCWGDSLTAGAGGEGTTYPNVLAELIGTSNFDVINAGVGGETSYTIAGRQGGRVFTLESDVVLPASGKVAISLTDYFGSPVAPLRQGGSNHINPCYVDGVECTMTVTQTSSTSEDYQLYLERVTPATGTRTIHAGTPIITNYMKLYQNAYALVIWIGTNGTFEYSGSGDTYQNTLVDQIKAMIEYNNTRKVIVIGMHRVDNGPNSVTNLLQLESLCGKVFGAKFIDWRKYLITNALSDAGITPTIADEQAISEGKCPPSLLSDTVHLNATGYDLMARLIYSRMSELGYI